LLVWERAGIWATGLRAALGRGEREPTQKRPIEIRHEESAEEELALSPCSLIVVEITAENVGRMTAWLAGLRRRWPHAVPIAVAERGLAEWESLVREAGAENWFESPSQLAGIVRMFRRQLLRYPPPLPDLRTAWRDRLPW